MFYCPMCLTFVSLVHAALVDLQGELHDDVEDDEGHHHPAHPVWHIGLAHTHTDEDSHSYKVKAYANYEKIAFLIQVMRIGGFTFL